jgi:putative addiction module component (TIGR02574 family)
MGADTEFGPSDTDNCFVPLTDAQRAELKRRYEEDETHPDDVTSWEDIKASAIARLAN